MTGKDFVKVTKQCGFRRLRLNTAPFEDAPTITAGYRYDAINVLAGAYVIGPWAPTKEEARDKFLIALRLIALTSESLKMETTGVQS